MNSLSIQQKSPLSFRRIKKALAFITLFSAFSANAQVLDCNCSNSSLMGTKVGTLLNSHYQGPTITTVGPGVELPNAGPTLGAAGPSPRFNINIGANSIRIDFLQQVATYGPGSKFTFSNLHPVSPTCGKAKIILSSVTTNKLGAAPYVVTPASFTADTVVLPFAPATNVNWNPGEYIQADLRFGCDVATPVSSCCPEFTKTIKPVQVGSMFTQSQHVVGNPYTMTFDSSGAFSNGFESSLKAWATWLAVDGCPGVTGFKIDYQLYNTNSPAKPSGPSTVGFTASGAPQSVTYINGVVSPATFVWNVPASPNWWFVKANVTPIGANGQAGQCSKTAGCLDRVYTGWIDDAVAFRTAAGASSTVRMLD